MLPCGRVVRAGALCAMPTRGGGDVERPGTAAPRLRRFDAERTRAGPASSSRRARRSAGRKAKQGAGASRRDPTTVARIRPTGCRGRSDAPRRPPPCGRKGLQLVRAARGSWPPASVEPQQIEYLPILGGPATRGSVPSQRDSGEPQIFRLHGIEFREALHLEQSGFLQPAAADDIQIGKRAMVFRPTLSLNLSIWSVAALRLAMTPPSRTA